MFKYHRQSRAGFAFIIFFFLSLQLIAQQRTLFTGTPEAGSVIIGRADKIKSIIFEKKKLNFSKDGYFVFGFDRDAKGKYVLKITFKDKKTETYTYQIEPREYEVQRINGLPKNMVTPSRKLRARISRESKIIAGQKKKMLTDYIAYFKNGFITPVDSVDIRSLFGSARILDGIKKNPHNGIDFGADEGTPVKAAGDGVVLVALHNFYYNGTFVMIDHGLGLITIYLHLSRLDVKKGDKVKKGEIIGAVGSTGRATGPHLHFGVELFKKRIDPMSILQLKTGGQEETSK